MLNSIHIFAINAFDRRRGNCSQISMKRRYIELKNPQLTQHVIKSKIWGGSHFSTFLHRRYVGAFAPSSVESVDSKDMNRIKHFTLQSQSEALSKCEHACLFSSYVRSKRSNELKLDSPPEPSRPTPTPLLHLPAFPRVWRFGTPTRGFALLCSHIVSSPLPRPVSHVRLMLVGLPPPAVAPP